MADKPKKPQKLKARLPRGLEDRGPAAIAATRQMVEKIREVYERYGFEPVETPAMEYTDALGKFLPDQDRPNEGVFSFQDDDEQWISLRYDLTAPLRALCGGEFRRAAKAVSQLPRRLRLSATRSRAPAASGSSCSSTPTRWAQRSPAADAEMCMMAADTMEALGIPRGSYVVKVNNRKVLDGVLEASALAASECGRRLTVLRAIDKLDRFRHPGSAQAAWSRRWDGGKDESGDFTKGRRA